MLSLEYHQFLCASRNLTDKCYLQCQVTGCKNPAEGPPRIFSNIECSAPLNSPKIENFSLSDHIKSIFHDRNQISCIFISWSFFASFFSILADKFSRAPEQRCKQNFNEKILLHSLNLL